MHIKIYSLTTHLFLASDPYFLMLIILSTYYSTFYENVLDK